MANEATAPEIERLFSPEFRNRLDEIVSFAPLAPEVMGHVVDKFVREVEEQLRERRIVLELAPEARAWLAEKGYDASWSSVRWPTRDPDELKAVRWRRAVRPLAKGGRVRVGVAGGTLHFEQSWRRADADQGGVLR